jgi:hypothetical protein
MMPWLRIAPSKTQAETICSWNSRHYAQCGPESLTGYKHPEDFSSSVKAIPLGLKVSARELCSPFESRS